jgi:cytochrome c oxidase cbb3-type subunit III
MLRVSTTIFIAACLILGCEREERVFRVAVPTSDMAALTPMPTIYAGATSRPSAVPNEFENNAYAMTEGKRLYTSYNCVGCHAHGGGGMGPPLIDDLWIYGSEPQQVYSTIIEGRPNGMPSFAGKIPNHQAWQIAGYVRSMSGLTNPNAAPGREDHLKNTPPENTMTASPKSPTQSGTPPSGQMPR